MFLNFYYCYHSERLERAREAFKTGRTKDVSFRKSQLKALYSFLKENEMLIVSALQEDFKKPSFETRVAEVDFVMNDIRGALFNIDEYVKPRYVSKTLAVIVDDAYMISEPYGLVLIIGAWNYPIQVALSPLVGAIMAGNAAVLKPSEMAPATARLLAELLPKYLDSDCYQIVTGNAQETQELLSEHFDYIFFTGSNRVGRQIHQAAAKHLTPATLELGGKSPLYIDDSVPDFEMAWRRILWGKMINAGQTCVAPDYILCSSSMEEKLIEKAKVVIKEFFGENPRLSNDFARIINERHFERIGNIIKSGKVAIGGDLEKEELYIAPTILTNVTSDDPIMQEEIFGPILPIVTAESVDEAIDFINSRDKPLTLYVFSTRLPIIRKLIENTSSGSGMKLFK